ncbi:MAG TPA: M48 family metalloprotease [Gemmatimonadaceae bacterium]|nr:M48 family metalloprotease [Gemmatimonadaceae bacterium]
MLGPILVTLIAIAPGAVNWWTGRRLARATDDPALPELLMARQQRLVAVGATSLAILLVLGGRHVWWGVLLLATILLTGGYPLRRTLLGETAALPLYLWRSLKSMVGGMGFWILLVWTPTIVLGIDRERWWLALLLLPVLLVWEFSYQRIWLRLHDAEPLASPALAPRIATIVDRAGIPAPALYRIGAPGTRFVNALAFPSVRRPAIGLGNALLELLEPDEIAAVYAHELSHIEQFSPRVVRRLQLVTWLLILAAIGVPLLAGWLAPASAHWAAWLWPLVVLLVLAQRAKKSQEHEHESDLRAAALCGDAEAVARGLVKIHVHAFIPRRWAVDFERNATHPSLARRIQALRGQGAEAVSSLGAPAVLPTAREGSLVVFENERAWWFDGVPAGTAPDLEALRAQAASARSVAWPYLIELRVTTSGEGRALQARHRNGDRWSVPLEASQVAAVQRALDHVDVRLQRELGRTRPGNAWPLAAGILLAMLLSGQVGILLVPVTLVLVRPATAALGALGAMAIAAAAFGLASRDGSWMLPDPRIGLAVIAVLGALALASAWRHRRAVPEDLRRNGRLTLLVLGAVGALLTLSVLATLWDAPTRAWGERPGVSTLAVTLLGMAAALALMEARAARRWSAAATLSGLAAGAPVLLEGLALSRDDGLSRAHASLAEIARIPLGGTASSLQLSPGGQRFLVQRYDARPITRTRPAPPMFVLGDSTGALREIGALHAAFAGDEHLLTLQAGDSTLELRLERVDADAMLWSSRLPDLYQPTLIVSPEDRTWAVVGEEAGSDSLAVVAGTFDAPGGRTRRFAPLDSIGALDHIVFDGGATVLLPAISQRPPRPFILDFLSFSMPDVDLWEVSAAGHRRIGSLDGFPQCGPPDSGAAICLIRRGRGASVWTVGPRGAERLVSRLRDLGLAQMGPGARMTAVTGPERVTDVDLVARRLTEITLPAHPGVYEARVSAGRLAALRTDSTGTTLLLYRIATR